MDETWMNRCHTEDALCMDIYTFWVFHTHGIIIHLISTVQRCLKHTLSTGENPVFTGSAADPV